MGVCFVICSFISCVCSVIALYIALPITPCCLHPIDANSTTVAILSILVTILIGWNIYSVIDLKDYKHKYKQLSKRIDIKTNYLHNKSDYHYGLTMIYISISLAGSISYEGKSYCKFQMYLQGLQGIKILSNLGEFEYCNSLIGILSSTEANSDEIKLTLEERKQIIILLKETPHAEKLHGLYDLIKIQEKRIDELK